MSGGVRRVASGGPAGTGRLRHQGNGRGAGFAPPRIVWLAGEPYAQGLQHAHAIPPRARDHLLALIARAHPSRAADDLLAAMRHHARETVETVEGLAVGLGVSFAQLWAYTARGYVADLAEGGCSVAALGGAWPLLGKNRDFSRSHEPLQALIAARPTSGHPWLSLGSFGSPGVYSSGLNAVGLAVADTHVRSQDVGPGAPRFSLMQQVLERCASVPEAVALLSRVPRVGTGTVSLADAAGRVACVELSHRHTAVREPDARGWLIATNHYRHPRLRRFNGPPPGDDGDATTSQARAARLLRTHPPATPEALLDLLATHAGPLDTLCRHSDGPEGDRATLSTVVYQPRDGAVFVRLGRPCETPTTRLAWSGAAWE